MRQADEDVLSQLRRSLHIEEFGCENKAASDVQNEEMDVRHNEERDDEQNKEANKAKKHQGQDKSAGVSTSLPEASEYLTLLVLFWQLSGHALTDSCCLRPFKGLRCQVHPVTHYSSGKSLN